MKPYSMIKTLLSLAGASVLTGCLTTSGGNQSGFRAVDETGGLVVFDPAAMPAGARERIVYATAWEREEYTLYKTPEVQAEFVYIKTRETGSRRLYIDGTFNLDGPLDSFRHTRAGRKSSGDAFRLKIKDGSFWVKDFQLSASSETCVVLSGGWGQTDKFHSAANALFGFVCMPGTMPLSRDQMEQTIQKIGVRGFTTQALGAGVLLGPPAADDVQAELKARAQGLDNTNQGIEAYPYHIVRFLGRNIRDM